MMRYVAARARYNEWIVNWKSDRLEKSGKVSSARMAQIALSGLQRGSPRGNPMAGLGAVMDMFAKAEDIAKLEEAGDRRGACRAKVALLANFKTIDATVSKQWESIEAALDAEAARVGVSFD